MKPSCPLTRGVVACWAHILRQQIVIREQEKLRALQEVTEVKHGLI